MIKNPKQEPFNFFWQKYFQETIHQNIFKRNATHKKLSQNENDRLIEKLVRRLLYDFACIFNDIENCIIFNIDFDYIVTNCY